MKIQIQMQIQIQTQIQIQMLHFSFNIHQASQIRAELRITDMLLLVLLQLLTIMNLSNQAKFFLVGDYQVGLSFLSR